MKNEPLKHFLSRQLSPDINYEFEETEIEGKRIVVLTIPAAKNIPTSFNRERFIRIGSSKEKLLKYPEKESYLFEVLRHGLPNGGDTFLFSDNVSRGVSVKRAIDFLKRKRGIGRTFPKQDSRHGLFTQNCYGNTLSSVIQRFEIRDHLPLFSGPKNINKYF